MDRKACRSRLGGRASSTIRRRHCCRSRANGADPSRRAGPGGSAPRLSWSAGPGRATDSRAICLHARTMEALDLRGRAGGFARRRACRAVVPARAARRRSTSACWTRIFRTCWTSRRARSRRCCWPGPRPRRRGPLVDRGDGARAGRRRASASRWPTAARPTPTMSSGATECTVRPECAWPSRSRASTIRARSFSLIFAWTASHGRAYGDLSRNGMLLIFPFRDGFCRVVLYDSGWRTSRSPCRSRWPM